MSKVALLKYNMKYKVGTFIMIHIDKYWLYTVLPENKQSLEDTGSH